MIHTGDCIEVMAGMPADSVDAICTDPPYGLEFMGKRWDAFKSPGRGARVRKERAAEMTPTGQGHSTSAGPFLAAGVDQYVAGTPFQAWCEAWGREALRVTKPGGYLLAFGGTRTHHRLVCGLEDAGWIIRDELDWIYASGFPKGKANLKPAHEPIVLARKPGPLRPLAIDECRIPTNGERVFRDFDKQRQTPGIANPVASEGLTGQWETNARWPSNLLLSDPELFDVANPYVVGSGAGSSFNDVATWRSSNDGGTEWGNMDAREAGTTRNAYGDTGGYSRFFIVPKADRVDREPVLRGQLTRTDLQTMGDGANGHDPERPIMRENAHPTVKPVDLMRHLVRLVTPTNPPGVVLDPFLGSGSTAIACELEGFPWIGIEKELEYVKIAEARLNGTQRGLGLDVGAPVRKSKMDPRVIASKGPGRPEGAAASSWFHDPEEVA